MNVLVIVLICLGALAVVLDAFAVLFPGSVIVLICLAGLAAAAVGYWRFLRNHYAMSSRANEIHVVKTPDLWRIRVFRYMPRNGVGEPVLLVHGTGANHLNLTTPQGVSLVDVLTERGYDCWAVELRGTRSSEPPFGRRRTSATLDECLAQDLPAVVAYIKKSTGYAKVHWVGHSLGGMLLYAYEQAFGPDDIASGVTLGTPPGFEDVPFDHPTVLLTLIQVAHNALEYVARALTPLVLLVKPQVVYAPVNWSNLHPRVTGKIFFNLLEVPPPPVAQELCFWVSHRIWRMQGDQLDVVGGLSTMRVPLFAVFGAADPLVPLDRAREFFDGLPISDKRMIVLGKRSGYDVDYSHVDLAFGANAQRDVFAPIAEWLEQHPIGAMPVLAEESRAKKRARTMSARKVTAKSVAPAKKAVAKKKAAATRKVADAKAPVKKRGPRRKSAGTKGPEDTSVASSEAVE